MLHALSAFSIQEKNARLHVAQPKAALDIAYLSPVPPAFAQTDGSEPAPTREFPNHWYAEAGTTKPRRELGMIALLVPSRTVSARRKKICSRPLRVPIRGPPVARIMRTLDYPKSPVVALVAWLAIAAAGVSAAVPAPLAPADATFLDDLERRAVRFFVEHTDRENGLTRDRAPTDGTLSHAPSSVAATGFALTAWCIADERGWVRHDEARRRVRQTLRFVATAHDHERGWLFHFVDVTTGRRVWRCEASTIDTALLLQGALTAREHFRDDAITALVDELNRRIDWRWALNGGTTVTHGWRPETGFLRSRWDNYA
jgi:hypothetical protein